MHQDYEGAAFFPGLASGRASGVVRVTAGALLFETKGAQVELPLEGLELRLGGASARLIFFSHATQPDWSVYTSDHSILADPELQSRQPLAAQISRLRGKKWLGHGVTAAVISACVLAIVGLLVAKEPIVRAVADQVPASLEVKLGETVFAQLDQGDGFLEGSELEDSLARMTAPLLAVVPQHEYRFHFHIAEDESINAFALPGGPVVIHSGLVLRADAAEEVVGVLAHEIAHVTRRHTLRQVVSTLGLFTLVQAFFGDLTGIAAVLTEGGAELLTLGFSRDFEREADDEGWSYLVAAGIDPRGMIGFFEKLRQEKEQRDGLGGARAYLGFLSTHPTTPERIARLTRKLEGSPAGTRFQPMDVDFRAFQEVLGRTQYTAVTEGDETDANQD